MTTRTSMSTTLPLFSERALCAEQGPNDDLWFPHQSASKDVRAAKKLCAQCPAIDECLETALQIGPACAGIWGGMTERQRRKVRTRRRRLQLVAERFGPELELGA